jgi:hypothetical protein
MAIVKRLQRKPPLTDDEIDALVIAEAHDPEAWGEPVVVEPSKSKRPAWIARAKQKSGNRSGRSQPS